MELLFIFVLYFVLFCVAVLALGAFVYFFYLVYEWIKIDLENWDE